MVVVVIALSVVVEKVTVVVVCILFIVAEVAVVVVIALTVVVVGAVIDLAKGVVVSNGRGRTFSKILTHDVSVIKGNILSGSWFPK